MGAQHTPGFTPGPWRVDPGYPGDIQTGDGSMEIARVYDQHNAAAYGMIGVFPTSRDEKRANARLIAAAPDMFEALRKLAAEVGALRAFEGGVRAEISNTNWSVLMLRLAEADAALARAAAAEG